MKVILASSSQWRKQLLEDAGIACVAVDAGVDESVITAANPELLAQARADAKAAVVAEKYPTSWVVAADQVAHMGGVSFGKPADRDEWRSRLKALRGRRHTLTTAVALVHGEMSRRFSVSTDVFFRSDLEDTEIEAYMDLGEAKNCAGGYMVERRGAWLVERCEGDWNNVIGLPVLHLISELRLMGWRYPVAER